MARRDQFTLSLPERQRRRFSDGFKKQKVKEIELGYTKVAEVCRQYQVSDVSVYVWLDKFGTMGKSKKERLIVESESDTVKLLEFKKKVAELEQIIGQKQVIIDFQKKMMDLAEEHYQIDIKKKFLLHHRILLAKTRSNECQSEYIVSRHRGEQAVIPSTLGKAVAISSL